LGKKRDKEKDPLSHVVRWDWRPQSIGQNEKSRFLATWNVARNGAEKDPEKLEFKKDGGMNKRAHAMEEGRKNSGRGEAPESSGAYITLDSPSGGRKTPAAEAV